MPNWCVQNWILRGPKEEIQRFCDKVNSCLEREGRPNGFGKYWLGNLCECFGYEYEELKKNSCPGLRGVFCPEPEECACLSCPEAEEVPIHPEDFNKEFSRVAFSVAHAWGPSDWFQIMVDEQFPTLMQCWKATDEFGNFHCCRNGEAFGIDGKYEVEHWKMDTSKFFKENDKQGVCDYIKTLTNGELVFEPNKIDESNEFYAKLNEWNEAHEFDEIYVHFWNEE